MKEENNLAFIDGQNLYMGTTKSSKESWQVNLVKFRIYFIFNVMKKLYKQERFDKVILVSGDGDYKMLVDFLIEEGKFKKILFPNKKFASSLYKEIGSEYFDYLENKDVKKKLHKRKRLLRH